MQTFDDFDAWGDAVRSASLRLACDGVERRTWTLGMIDLGRVVVQVATEGGGNICYGANTHAGPILFLPLTHAAEHVVNGERLDAGSLLAIPRGGDFLIRVRRRAHAWCSIALPDDVPAPASSTKLTGEPGAVAGLRRVVRGLTASLLDRPAGSAAHTAAAQALHAAAVDCLAGGTQPRAAVGRPRIDRRTIMRRAIAAIDAAATLPTAAELARDVGVTGRTLQRAFHEAFGLSPKRYLLLRQLHAVRRSLRDAGRRGDTVGDVLMRHGIWEFGRFAARYRRHFDELPSATLRRR